MAIEFVRYLGGAEGAASCSITTVDAKAAGNAVVMAVGCNGSRNPGSYADAGSNSYTEQIDNADGGVAATDPRAAIASSGGANAVSAGAAAFSCGLSGFSGGGCLMAAEFSGVDAFVASAKANGTGPEIEASIAGVQAGELVIAVVNQMNTGAAALALEFSHTFTSVFEYFSNTYDVDTLLGYYIATGSGTVTVETLADGAGEWAVVLARFSAAGGGEEPVPGSDDVPWLRMRERRRRRLVGTYGERPR